MLICPQCLSNNPNTNKFCQSCGTSLTYKVCLECSSKVAFSAKQCQNCGKMTGTFWWAIVSRKQQNKLTSNTEQVALLTTSQQKDTTNLSVSLPVVADSRQSLPQLPLEKQEIPDFRQVQNSVNQEPSPPTLEATPSGDNTVSPTPPEAEHHPQQTFQISLDGAYLDQQQRYQLLEPLPPQQEMGATAEVQVKVLDCQPLQISPLMAGADSLVRETLPYNDKASSDFVKMAIPTIAKTYLALQSQFSQIFPTIHDAWQQGEQQVVLVEDRSDWQMLSDLWQDKTTTLLQILPWLYEMTRLWEVLEPWHCRQSLLELSNLRVNQAQALSLQRLYIEAEKPLNLHDLGQLWQALFQESQKTQLDSLINLLHELQTGNIQTIDNLRSRLELISNQLQADVSSTPGQQTVPFRADDSNSATLKQVAVTLSTSAAPTILQPAEPNNTPMKTDDIATIVLPMQLVSLEDAGRTDVGRQRNHNEDYFGIETKIKKLEFPKKQAVQARGIYILCDGMGGHAGGEEASKLAVTTLQEYFKNNWKSQQLPSEESIRSAVLLANKAIHNINQQNERSGVGRMGTTLVMVLLQDTQVAVAHVGDSRLYRLSRKLGLEQVSVDHEVGQREILRGVERAIAYNRPDAYQLTQALGPRDENFVNPDVQFLQLKEDTLLILASDGLSDNDLIEHNWQTHLEPLLSSEVSLERGVSNLIDLANQYNGHDNITAVAIRAKVRPDTGQEEVGE